LARSIRGEQVEIVNGTVEKRHSLARARPRRAAVHGARRASLGKRRARAETGAMEEEKKYIKKKVRSKARRRARRIARPIHPSTARRSDDATNDATRALTPDARPPPARPTTRPLIPRIVPQSPLPSPLPRAQIRPGTIVLADAPELALLVNYELEGTMRAPDGVTIITEKSRAVKRVKVRALDASVNLASLAAEIVEKCKLIHHSKVALVEELLDALRRRELGGGVGGARGEARERGGAAATTTTTPAADPPRGREGAVRSSSAAARAARASFSSSSSASGAAMETDLAALRGREDERVVREAADAAAAFTTPAPRVHVPSVRASPERLDEYLEKLYEDDIKIKVEATLHIAALAKRVETLEDILAHPNAILAVARTLREDGRKSVDLATNIVSVFFALSNYSAFHHIVIENQLGDMTMRIVDLEVKRAEDRLESLHEHGPPDEFSLRRHDAATRKQDRLFYVCFYLLLNISEDPAVERKMKKRNIVTYLCKMLERRSVDLLVLCVTFLKKLSIYGENVQKMTELNAVARLATFVPGDDVLLLVTLRLLLNLSFDDAARAQMQDAGLIPPLVRLMRHPHFQHVSMAILYHLSVDDERKASFPPVVTLLTPHSVSTLDRPMRRLSFRPTPCLSTTDSHPLRARSRTRTRCRRCWTFCFKSPTCTPRRSSSRSS